MWKFTGFKKMEVKGVQVIRLYLANENDSRVHLDCDITLDEYNVADLIGKDYQAVDSVKDLVKKYKLTKRTQSNFERISSFKLGA